MMRYFYRLLDVSALFCLVGLAHLLAALQRMSLHPFARQTSRRLPVTPQRIVFFIHGLGLGGAQRQLVLCIKHLNRDRWTPEVVTLDKPDKFFEPDLQALHVPIVRLKPYSAFVAIGMLWQLLKHLHSSPCHILHNWLPDAVQFGAVAGKLLGIPVIVGSLRSEGPDCAPGSVSKYRRTIDICTMPLNTVLIANSNAVRQSNMRWAFIPERKIVTIYNGIETDVDVPTAPQLQSRLKSELGFLSNSPVVGIVARLDMEKDHITFLRAARLISNVKPETCFLVVGDGPVREEIISTIKDLGICDQVRVLPRRQDVYSIMQLLDVFVLTSLSEGLPNVLLEAAVCGVPVVTTASGGASEAVVNAETGYVVSCGDAEAVAKQVLRLLADGPLRRRLTEAAKERTRSLFSIRQISAEIETLYARCLEGSTQWGDAGRPVRVCFISSQAYGLLRPDSGISFGGAEVQITTLAKELARDQNFEVTILTGNGECEGTERDGNVLIVLHPLCSVHPNHVPPQFAGQGALATEKMEGLWDVVRRQGYRWLDRCPPSVAGVIRSAVRGGYACRRCVLSLPPFRRLIRSSRECRTVIRWFRLFRSMQADIYVMRCAAAQVGYMQMACSLLRRPFVYMVAHEIDVSGEYVQLNPDEGRLYEKGLRQADAIVCQNGKQLELLRRRYRLEGNLIPSLCPFGLSDASGTQLRRMILWVARVDEWKQPELFLELARRMPGQSLVMVAPPSQVNPDKFPSVRAQAADLPNLLLLEGISLEQANVLFQEALVFVNTSRAEGFPNTFLQAAACGTPIVSWAVNPDGVLDHYQMGYCANQDWSRFEHSIRLLCDDASLRAQLGANGRRFVIERHNPAVITRQYVDLFHNLRDRRTGRRWTNRVRFAHQEKRTGRDATDPNAAAVTREE